MIFVDFFADDCFGGLGFAAAIFEIRGGDLLEIIDIVNETAFDLVHAGINVARDGDIDEEHGAVAAALKEVLAVGADEYLFGGAGAGDDDVGSIGLLVDGFEWDNGGETEALANSAAIFSARE